MNECNPIISIIVPVYKVEKYIDKCIESVLAQDYENIEIILVDDGSPDNCPQICDKYAKKYKNIISLHKPNGGLGSARNYGVEHASGKWIAFVDSDDFVRPEYISNMWSLCEKYKADIVSCGVTQVDEYDNELTKSVETEFKILSGEEAFFQMYFARKIGHRSYSKLIKKEVIKKHPFPKGYFEDFATTYLWLSECDVVVIGDRATDYRYVQRSGSILNSQLSERHMHAFEICDEISNYVHSNFSAYEKYSCLLYLGQTIQMLNKQHMSRGKFNEIYKKYQKMYRNSFGQIYRDNCIPKRIKAYLLLLCITPGVYRFARKLKKQ